LTIVPSCGIGRSIPSTTTLGHIFVAILDYRTTAGDGGGGAGGMKLGPMITSLSCVIRNPAFDFETRFFENIVDLRG
jgi:hypothetical protein